MRGVPPEHSLAEDFTSLWSSMGVKVELLRKLGMRRLKCGRGSDLFFLAPKEENQVNAKAGKPEQSLVDIINKGRLRVNRADQVGQNGRCRRRGKGRSPLRWHDSIKDDVMASP